jgi:hypothetical protein
MVRPLRPGATLRPLAVHRWFPGGAAAAVVMEVSFRTGWLSLRTVARN